MSTPLEPELEALIAAARIEVARRDGGPVPTVVALQERADEQTRLAGEQLLSASDPAERILGTLILREFGAVHTAARARNRDRFTGLVAELLSHEQDEEVVEWAISAVGFLRGARGLPVLLRFRTHPSPLVRDAVASALAAYIDTDRAEVVQALCELGADSVSDVRWSALYELSMWAPDSPAVRDRLQCGLTDPDARVRTLASEGLARLGG